MVRPKRRQRGERRKPWYRKDRDQWCITQGTNKVPLRDWFNNHTECIVGVASSPDGQRALSRSDDKTARLWDARTGAELQRFTAHKRRLAGVAFSPLGGWALSGGRDGTARAWDVASDSELRCVDLDPSPNNWPVG